MKFTIFQESRQGGRKYNQDRMGYSYSRDALLLVVADGMGGHLHGEVAAQIAVELLTDQFQKKAEPALANPVQFLVDAFQRCHEAIYHYAANHQMVEVPRTTCVACVVQDGIAYWAHVGDSRLYLLRQHRVVAQTRDHSKVRKMVENGAITEEEARTHAEKNKIYSCLGGSYPPEIDVGGKIALADGDTVLLCTDGFWGQVDDDEIMHFLSAFPVLFAIPQLLDRAELRGGKFGDNLTALAINWHEEDDRAGEDAFVSTQKLDHHTVATHVNPIDAKRSSGSITEDDIERAIAEIQAAIAKYSK
ncbi:protein phosphatase 2C domain-containing protein [Chitiniphilus purpureus]|uniref:Protein phosphatase 2C domain-containing protein n=1 Tax=Chitiniphilus purpureus TaxID=2981137 RepID=A0ABY6DM97_9NEIS|nr:protein phosphatase 2C domain-containing protein [Chitiniphilus sp. CD1]UXY15333.1 protein phosphatase 2C domain-containing protein [Chitiniphilus sp. CD1]